MYNIHGRITKSNPVIIVLKYHPPHALKTNCSKIVHPHALSINEIYLRFRK